MRALSFIPAFLFAAASFVAAAPASIPVDTSCVSNPTGGSGSDAALQPVIAIINNATNYIQPLSDQLCMLSFVQSFEDVDQLPHYSRSQWRLLHTQCCLWHCGTNRCCRVDLCYSAQGCRQGRIDWS